MTTLTAVEPAAPAKPQDYVYVVVRKDIALCDQITQAAHAAIQATNLWPSHEPWLVMLQVSDQAELARLSDRLNLRNIDNAMFYEPDDDLGYTALATRALSPDERRHLRGLRLWRE